MEQPEATTVIISAGNVIVNPIGIKVPIEIMNFEKVVDAFIVSVGLISNAMENPYSEEQINETIKNFKSLVALWNNK